MGRITYNYILTRLILASACTYMRGKKKTKTTPYKLLTGAID